jgi:hypothetical protein
MARAPTRWVDFELEHHAQTSEEAAMTEERQQSGGADEDPGPVKDSDAERITGPESSGDEDREVAPADRSDDPTPPGAPPDAA